MYTGVRLKGAAYDGPPTRDYAPDEPMIESVLLSRCTSDTSSLEQWGQGKLLLLNPPELPGAALEGWRDPFIIRRGHGGGQPWQMLMGSGYKRDGRKNGCVMLYNSGSMHGPWEYQGIILEGDFLLGRVWECPGLAQIMPEGSHPVDVAARHNGNNGVDGVPAHAHHRAGRDFVVTTSGQPGHAGKHLLVVGAYQSTDQNEAWAWDPCVYYIGDFDGASFQPHDNMAAERLDLGDATYAANFHVDGQGRTVLWLWLRDPRPLSLLKVDYCGCLAVPRLVSYTTGPSGCPRLFQQPLPELLQLRRERLWHAGPDATIPVDGTHMLPEVCGQHVDCEIHLQRAGASHSGICLKVPGAMDSLAVLVSWDTDEVTWLKGTAAELEALQDPKAACTAAASSMTGPLGLQAGAGACGKNGGAAGEVTLRVIIDGSAVEVFTSTGQAVSTRVYMDGTGGMQVVAMSVAGSTEVHGGAWVVGDMWLA